MEEQQIQSEIRIGVDHHRQNNYTKVDQYTVPELSFMKGINSILNWM